MLMRHKVPTVFNIYMLDIICCALGCVILLWQVAHQEAEDQTDKAKKQEVAAKSAQKDFEKAKDDLLSASNDVSDLQATLAEWQVKYQGVAKSLADTEKDRDAANKLAADRQVALDKMRFDLGLSDKQLKRLQADLEELLASEKKSKAERTGLVKLNAEMLAKIALSEKKITELKGEITLKQGEIDAAKKKWADGAAALKLSEEELRKLKKLADALRDDSKETLNQLKLTELQLKMREQDLDKSRKELLAFSTSKDKGAKELADAKSLIEQLTRERDQWKEKGLASNAALGTLTQEKDKLSKRIVDLQAEVEQRFAGIPLTGENVVFLIDISGSMALKDENVDDPEKWPFLCETLMKLMKSIPTLQRFQVILFSDKASYLFGNRDSWYKYEGPKTAKQTHDALRKVKVEGGTNMHAGFEEAFRYRKIKLDTIYLFSDGLPNLGEGVPASVAKLTEAQRNQYLSKFIRDKLKSEWNSPKEGEHDVRINAVGFFFESPDVGAFLWALAREHRGAFVGLR
jgi:hypothetical protein